MCNNIKILSCHRLYRAIFNAVMQSPTNVVKMIVTAWSGSGGEYGLKINERDRDANFSKEWSSIELIIPGESIPVSNNIKKASFWDSTCRELINKKIGIWLRNQKLAPWPKGHPPKLTLTKIAGNKFRLE